MEESANRSTPRFGGIGRALSARNYRIYWYGNVFSVLGTWVQKLALGWLTWQLTGSPGWLGIITFASMVPTMVLSPIAGAIADRVGATRLVRVAMFLEGANILVIAALTMIGAITINLLLGLAILQGVLLAFDFPVRHALVPILVKRRDMSAAIALNSTTFFAGAFAGPALGGIIIATLGIGPAFIINAASFYFFIWMISLLRLEERKPRSASVRAIADDLASGFRYVFGHPSIRLVFAVSMTNAFLLRSYIDLLPGFAARVFERDAQGLAILTAAGGLGGLLTGLSLAARGRTEGLTTIFVISVFAGAAFLILFSATDIFWIGAVCLFVVGMALVSSAVSSQSLIQNRVDNQMRARVISITVSIAIGGPATGALILGVISEQVGGLRPPVAAFAVLALAVLAIFAPKIIRRRADLERDGDGHAG